VAETDCGIPFRRHWGDTDLLLLSPKTETHFTVES